MPVSEQTVAADVLLRRIERAPFGGPVLDIAPNRRTTVLGVGEADVDRIRTLLERTYGPRQEVRLRPDDAQSFSLELDPLAEQENWRSAQRLHEIIAFLRSPEGCPWDRAQDWSSLAPKVIEEAYEVVDAIASGDAAELAAELGDLLLIVALLTQIAEEQSAFRIEDVYELVNRKLIRRHPHVFGDDAADTPEAVLSTWQRVKREEQNGSAAPMSAFARLPLSMPSIAKAAAMRSEAGEIVADRLPDGDVLLEQIEQAIAEGRDPESELQAALQRKYATS